MRKSAAVLTAVLATASLAVGGWVWWIYREDQKELTRLTLASQVLTGVYSQSRIQTADAFYQFIFPFDFLPHGGKPWQELKLQAQLRRPVPPSDWETLDLVRLARKVGFDPDLGRYGFVVLHMRIRAGLDLEARPMTVEISQGQSGRYLILELPEPGITDVVVSDAPEQGRLPSPVLSPQDWKSLVEKLRPRILNRVLADGLLDESRRSAEKIFRRIMQSSDLPGYEIKWRSPAAPAADADGKEQ